MTELSLETVTATLQSVEDPVFGEPMISLGTLIDVEVGAHGVRATVRLASPSERVRESVRTRIEEALTSLGSPTLELDFEVAIPTREVMGDDPLPDVRNVVLVMSGKGGVGKSTSAVNLALALSRLGTRVGVLDADFYGPSIPTMLGVSGQPVSKDGKRLSPLSRFGLSMMSIGFLLEDDKQAVVWRGPMLHGALSQFLTDVDWGTLDYLILDLPPGTGDIALTMAQKLRVTGCVMVTTPQEVALQDVYKSVSMCQKLNIDVLGVVENMSYFIDSAGVKHELFGRGGGEKIAKFAEAPLLGQVPIESAVREWGDKGMPIVQAQPDSEVARAFSSIAEQLGQEIAKRHFARTGGAKAPPTKGPTRLKIVR